jgi:hypothetical protein
LTEIDAGQEANLGLIDSVWLLKSKRLDELWANNFASPMPTSNGFARSPSTLDVGTLGTGVCSRGIRHPASDEEPIIRILQAAWKVMLENSQIQQLDHKTVIQSTLVYGRGATTTDARILLG